MTVVPVDHSCLTMAMALREAGCHGIMVLVEEVLSFCGCWRRRKEEVKISACSASDDKAGNTDQ